ncbi:MAG: HEAT repeat domain-containing protein [Cyanobacteria bacterium P01_A01_bin.83]
MLNLQQVLDEVLKWFKLNRPEYHSSLYPGLTQFEVDREAQNLPFKLTQELYQLYQCKNGSPFIDSTEPFDTMFFPGYLFLSLQKGIAEYFQNIEIHEGYWHKNWFPVFSLEGYSFFVVCQNELIESSPVYYFDYEQVEPMIYYDNITTMIATIAECYQSGAYFLTPEGYVDENELKVDRIRIKNNPQQDKSALEKLHVEITFETLNEIAADLIKFKDPKTVATLLKILQISKRKVNSDDAIGIRTLACRILGDIGDPKAVIPLIKVISNEEQTIRYWGIISLGKLKDCRATNFLVKLLKGKDTELQKTVIVVSNKNETLSHTIITDNFI